MSAVRKIVLTAAAWIAVPLVAAAQSFPSKPVRVVVPYEPGGTVDLLARTLSPKMSEDLGQPLIVENRGGAGGQIGALLVARAVPDGYTFMFTVGATLVLSMHTQKSLPYHPINDFTPITAAVDTVLSIAAAPSFPANNVKELVEYIKRNPGKVSYGTTSVGGTTHLAMEQLALLAGAGMVHVPYKGGGPLSSNLVGEQIPLAAMPLAPLTPHIRSGKVKVLGVLLTRRYAGMPDVPTVAESVPGYEELARSGTWAFGPAGLPAPIVQRIRAAIVAALNVPENRSKIEAGGQVVVGNSPEEFAAQIRQVAELSGKLAKAIGFKAQ